MPDIAGTPRGGYFGAGTDFCATFFGVHRIECHKTGIIDPCVRIFKSLGEQVFERCRGLIRFHIQRACCRQKFAPADMIIKEETQPQQPCRTHTAAMIRQNEAHRFHQMRGIGPDHLTLHQGFTHKAKFIMFQIAQTTVNQLGSAGGCAAGQIFHFGKAGVKTTPDRITRNTTAVNTTANNENIIVRICNHVASSAENHANSILKHFKHGKLTRL